MLYSTSQVSTCQAWRQKAYKLHFFQTWSTILCSSLSLALLTAQIITFTITLPQPSTQRSIQQFHKCQRRNRARRSEFRNRSSRNRRSGSESSSKRSSMPISPSSFFFFLQFLFSSRFLYFLFCWILTKFVRYCRDINVLMSALKQIKEKAHKDDQKKNEEAISRCTAVIIVFS